MKNGNAKKDLNDIAVNLARQGRYNEAIETFNKALETNPSSYDVHFNLGMVLQLIGEDKKAIESFENALKINKNILDAHIFLYYQYRKFCIWKDLDELNETITDMSSDNVNRKKGYGETPFRNLVRVDDPKQNLETAKVFTKEIVKNFSDVKEKLDFKYKKMKGKKVRLGYFASTIRDHPVGHLMAGIFKYHDRKRFEVYLYSSGVDDKSIWRKEAEKGCDKFVDVQKKNAVDIAKQINSDGVDIMIDLLGFADDTMLGVATLKPAPFVISYLGFPGSTGADFVDYAIVDKIIVPNNQTKYYSEKLINLPCYQVQSYFYYDRPKKIRKKEKGEQIIYCSFNSNLKITPDVFDSWMKILKKVPNSLLWLYGEPEEAKTNLAEEAQKRGVDWKRLVFHKRLPLIDHLERITNVDVALDTHHYCGGATTSNMLYCGVPVITMQGKGYLSRMSTSLVTAAGVPELITHSLKEYERLAVQLGNNPKRLASMKLKLLTNNNSQQLFDTKRFVRNLEKQYIKIVNGKL